MLEATSKEKARSCRSRKSAAARQMKGNQITTFASEDVVTRISKLIMSVTCLLRKIDEHAHFERPHYSFTIRVVYIIKMEET